MFLNTDCSNKDLISYHISAFNPDLVTVNETTDFCLFAERFGQRSAYSSELSRLSKTLPLPFNASKNEKPPEVDEEENPAKERLSIYSKINEDWANEGDTWPRVLKKGLGQFHRVVVIRERRRRGVYCSCDHFQRNRTCRESKKYGCIFLKIYPRNDEQIVRSPKQSDLIPRRQKLVDYWCKYYTPTVELDTCHLECTFMRSPPTIDPQHRFYLRNLPDFDKFGFTFAMPSNCTARITDIVPGLQAEKQGFRVNQRLYHAPSQCVTQDELERYIHDHPGEAFLPISLAAIESLSLSNVRPIYIIAKSENEYDWSD